MSGMHEGKEAVLQALGGDRRALREVPGDPDEMIEEGDTIVVLSHLDAETKSGAEVKLPGVELRRHARRQGKARPKLADTAELKQAPDG